MSQDKKADVETKLTEEEKLFEEKKAVNPYIAGFTESMAKKIQRRLLRKY
jgi:dGTP triphosphohydrolase